MFWTVSGPPVTMDGDHRYRAGETLQQLLRQNAGQLRHLPRRNKVSCGNDNNIYNEYTCIMYTMID